MAEELKRYYCNICKKTIAKEMFQYSMNKFNRALCLEHQDNKNKSVFLKDKTMSLQELVKKRHSEVIVPRKDALKSIKDWIDADFDSWDKHLSEENSKSYFININTEDKKLKYYNYVKGKDRKDRRLIGKIGGGKT